MSRTAQKTLHWVATLHWVFGLFLLPPIAIAAPTHVNYIENYPSFEARTSHPDMSSLPPIGQAGGSRSPVPASRGRSDSTSTAGSRSVDTSSRQRGASARSPTSSLSPIRPRKMDGLDHRSRNDGSPTSAAPKSAASPPPPSSASFVVDLPPLAESEFEKMCHRKREGNFSDAYIAKRDARIRALNAEEEGEGGGGGGGQARRVFQGGFVMHIARIVLSKSLVKKAKEKLKQKSFSCRRTLENLHDPEPLRDFEGHWRTASSLCDVCCRPALFDAFCCRSCDAVVHLACNASQGDCSESLGESADVSHMQSEHCFSCRETFVYEQKFHAAELRRLTLQRRLRQYGRYLAKIMYTHIMRKRYKRQRYSAVVMQSVARRFLARNRFFAIRRKLLRVVRLEYSQVPRLDHRSIIVFTAFDPAKNEQHFRLDKNIDKFAEHEGFIIPGISATVNLIMTLVNFEASRFVVAGQAVVSLRDLNACDAQDLVFNLTTGINFPPIESREEKMVYEMPPAPLGPQVHEPLNKVFRMRYTPLHHVTSMVAQVLAPPLDILKRPIESYVVSSGAAGTGPKAKERTTRWWICLAELKIIFYQFMGDSKQRYVCMIDDANIAVSKENKCVVLVNFGDRKKWSITFQSPAESHRFAFNVAECRRAAEGSSMFFSGFVKFNGLT